MQRALLSASQRLVAHGGLARVTLADSECSADASASVRILGRMLTCSFRQVAR